MQKRLFFLVSSIMCLLPTLQAQHIDTLIHCLRLYNDNATVYVYHGIPYAHADRFCRPELINGIDPKGIYIDNKTVCYQRVEIDDDSTQYGESHLVLQPGESSPMTEQCHVLTVNSPYPLDHPKTNSLPVLVYIHGGNYYAGGGERVPTQLAELALQENVITVSVTYRLGIFGYLYQPDSLSVNLGLQDQLTAIRWVYENIHRFGGDKHNITLAGQSAGAQSVVYCLADTTRPPIRRAVVFSAPMGLTTSKCIGQSRTNFVYKYLKNKGLDPWTCPADSLLEAQFAYIRSHQASWHSLPFSPTGLEQMPCRSEYIQWPEQVVVCAQKHDGSMFGPKPLWNAVTTMVFTAPAKRYTRYLRRQGVDAQYHLFTWEPQGSPLRAAHCAELPLLLDGTDTFWIGSWIMGDVSKEELLPKRQQFMQDFAHFMRTGEWNM